MICKSFPTLRFCVLRTLCQCWGRNKKVVPTPFSFFFLNYFYFRLHWVFVAARRLFSSCGEQGLLSIVVHRLLIVVASLVAEHGLQVCGLQQLWHAGSVVVAHGLSCSAACGIFPDQGSNPCPCIDRRILDHCANREAPYSLFLILLLNSFFFIDV